MKKLLLCCAAAFAAAGTTSAAYEYDRLVAELTELAIVRLRHPRQDRKDNTVFLPMTLGIA